MVAAKAEAEVIVPRVLRQVEKIFQEIRARR